MYTKIRLKEILLFFTESFVKNKTINLKYDIMMTIINRVFETHIGQFF